MDNIDYRKKYLKSFFEWQNIVGLMKKRIEELEKRLKEQEDENK